MKYKKQQLEPDMGRTNWFKIWESSMSRLYIVILLVNLYAEYIMWNAGLNDSQAAIKTAERNTNNFRYANDTTLMAESEEELNSFLIKVKEESEKAGLKLNIQKMKIMANGETMETVTDFIFLGSKITADGDCSNEIKRHLLLGRKVVTNLSSVQLLSRVRLFATPWTAAC